MVDRFDVAGLADGHADSLVAFEAHEQELVVAVTEEHREAAEDRLDVHVPLRVEHLLDDAEEVGHDLVLAIAQSVVLEEVEAHREVVLEIVDMEQGADRGSEDVGEHGVLAREEQILVARLADGADQRRLPRPGEPGEALGDGRGIGEAGPLGQRPRGDVESLLDPLIAEEEHAAVEVEEDRRRRRAQDGERDQVAKQGVALEKDDGLQGQKAGQGLADHLEAVIVGGAERSVQGIRAPLQQPAQQERGLLSAERPVEQAEHELCEEPEQTGAVLRALEVGPIPKERRLETLDEHVGVTKGVEVLGHGLAE